MATAEKLGNVLQKTSKQREIELQRERLQRHVEQRLDGLRTRRAAILGEFSLFMFMAADPNVDDRDGLALQIIRRPEETVPHLGVGRVVSKLVAVNEAGSRLDRKALGGWTDGTDSVRAVQVQNVFRHKPYEGHAPTAVADVDLQYDELFAVDPTELPVYPASDLNEGHVSHAKYLTGHLRNDLLMFKLDAVNAALNPEMSVRLRGFQL
jgi:hypothetical protein